MSVTSSGRSSMSSTIRYTSGWFFVMLLAMFCSSIVLPVRGGATMRPRCPLPMGTIRSSTRAERFSALGFERDTLLRVERRQVFEEHLLAGPLRRLEVDRFDLDQREVAFAVLRRPNLAGDGVAGVQIELANLRRRHVDVVGARAGSCSQELAGSRSRRAASRARLPRR